MSTRRMNARLFADIPWSSSEALKITLRRAAEQKMSVKLLALYADVDTPQDLSRLARTRAQRVHFSQPPKADLAKGVSRVRL